MGYHGCIYENSWDDTSFQYSILKFCVMIRNLENMQLMFWHFCSKWNMALMFLQFPNKHFLKTTVIGCASIIIPTWYVPQNKTCRTSSVGITSKPRILRNLASASKQLITNSWHISSFDTQEVQTLIGSKSSSVTYAQKAHAESYSFLLYI